MTKQQKIEKFVNGVLMGKTRSREILAEEIIYHDMDISSHPLRGMKNDQATRDQQQ